MKYIRKSLRPLVASVVSGSDPQIKMGLTEPQLRRWYNHLLRETLRPGNNRLNSHQVDSIMSLAPDHTPSEIASLLKVSLSGVKNCIIGENYNTHLERVRSFDKWSPYSCSPCRLNESRRRDALRIYQKEHDTLE